MDPSVSSMRSNEPELGITVQEGQVLARQPSLDQFQQADPVVCILVICGCSLVVLVQGGVECTQHSSGCKDQYAYILAVGTVSFGLSLFCVFWSVCAMRSFKKYSPVLAIFFLVWWAIGTFVATFSSPFEKSGNGYFGAWGAFVASFVMAGASSERLRNYLGSALTRVVAGSIEAKLSMGVAAASVVVLIAVVFEAADSEAMTTYELWGLICASSSFLFILFHTILRIPCERFTCHPMIFGVILSVWWCLGVAALTFGMPFKYAGNGFFATWSAFIFSVILAVKGADGYGGPGFSKRSKIEEVGAGPPHVRL